MSFAPLGVLGIVDRAAAVCRRRPLLMLSTVSAGSAPLALGAVLGVHLLRSGDPGVAGLLAGSAGLAAMAAVRAVGWGAGTLGLAAVLEGAPADPAALLARAARRAPALVAGQVSPLLWSLFGFLLAAGPLALAAFASNLQGNPFGSLGVAVAASAAGALTMLAVVVHVSRRLLALTVAAREPVGGRSAARRSRELVLGQTVRAAVLFGFHALVFGTLWLTLAIGVPFALRAAQVLTGAALTELMGVFSPGDPTYVAFQGALAFLILEPVKCLSWALFYEDCGARKEGADLRARLERWMAAPGRE
jgi:hypothetical protein